MALHLYNSLARKKEELKPADAKHIKMYVCGPTVYDRAHIGNARSVVIYDVLYRLLKHLYPKVTYVRNITDVDDKIIKAAKERGITINQLTKEMTDFFHNDMAALNVERPTEEPRATQYIPQMIQMMERLIKQGYAYAAEGHVLFDVTKYEAYGKLSGRSRENMIAGARVEVAPYKRTPGDFVLWKPADAEDDKSSVFDSPWGKGRPGWHIECSAMSTAVLGENFDIHGGGADLMFPHHENEIAQSCCANPGSHYAKYWIHNGFLTVNDEKMSKSLGNFITVKDLLEKGVKGEVIRYALLSTHYRAPLNWTEKLLEDSKTRLDATYQYLSAAEVFKEKYTGSNISLLDEADKYFNMIISTLSEDLNLSLALMQFDLAAKELHKLVKDGANPQDYINFMKKLGNLFGLLQLDTEKWFKSGSEDDKVAIQNLINERSAAKKSKDFQRADQIRKQLADMGIVLEDKGDGTTDWRKA